MDWKSKFISKVTLLFLIAFLFQSWGFYGHRRINRMAVLTLPPSMIGFYKTNIEYITAHAVDPDKRRYASKNEAPRHYIDIDHYGENAFEEMPLYWNDAVSKYSEDTLMAYGIVPWHVASMTYFLTEAFKNKDSQRILSLSADLGHYIADAHVPLHTTENYNGQLTNQKGIHGLWESRIPEIAAENYDYLVGRAQYIKSPIKSIWEVVRESHSHLDSVLYLEKKLTEDFPVDQKYVYEERGNTMIRQYSKEFAMAYSQSMGNMVEQRMRKALLMVGSLWYTAWVNAGQPDLNQLDLNEIQLATENDSISTQGKIFGREHDN